jgi:hypothetical protein
MAGRPNVGRLGHGRHVFGSPAARWLPGQDLTPVRGAGREALFEVLVVA